MDNPSFPSIKRQDAKGSEKYARHKTDLSIDFAAAASATLLKIQTKESVAGGGGCGGGGVVGKAFIRGGRLLLRHFARAGTNACSVYYVNIKCDNKCKLNAGETVQQMADK